MIVALALLVSGCDAAVGSASPPTATPTGKAPVKRPNIVFVLTDDLSWDLVAYMPNVRAMQAQGTTFTNFLVADTLCCPSRATILTGRYPHNTKVVTNDPPLGGFTVFRDTGGERQTFAVTLQQAGYRTALMGKYLNGYEAEKRPGSTRAHVPPGWTEWYATGLGYSQYGYTLNENGNLVQYGRRAGDYMVDVLGNKSVDFINRSAAAGQPFMLEISTFTPHGPAVAAPRHEKMFPGLTAPRRPAFNEHDVGDKPSWLNGYPKLDQRDMRLIDRTYRARVRSVQAIDELIGRLRQTLRQRGLADDTYVVFSSDNGYHLGEHRLVEGKMTAYDTDVKVPLIVTGPGVPAGANVDRLAQNTDLRPTFEELAGLTPPDWVDGRSLVPFLRGRPVGSWRTAALIEHVGPKFSPDDPDRPVAYGGNPPTYQAIRTQTELYVEYENGDREYYDIAADPHQLHNHIAVLEPARQAELAALLEEYRRCAGATCRER
ncbi:sulfatase family protein [Thermomonospora cellulosilytica]|uniref:Arylsulfatase A-like enzyme n=1 Tax=Thermomonospora cellulosilytica TaxID=1411118 RepID=A0A7W3MWM6_9ACTN|nr:sulfatase [Thermomonospora cellulosilytica]MBA9003199.1 arylsulfatase A-like enzyme [Thermomonospora cellulosilytica]